MGGETGLLGADEVGRQQQDSVRAGGLGGPGHLDRQGGALAGGGDDRRAAAGLLDAGAHDAVDLGGGEREELAGAAGGEQAGDPVVRKASKVVAVGGFVDAEIGVEMRDREGEQA